MESKYLNAKQIFELYGIPRSALGELARTGRVEVRRITTDIAVTNLYSIADIESIINGGSDDNSF